MLMALLLILLQRHIGFSMAKKKKTDNLPAEIIYENSYDKIHVMEFVISKMIEGHSLRYILGPRRNEPGFHTFYDHDDLQIEPFKLPDRVTFLRWLKADEDGELATSIAHARELQADALNDDITEIRNLMLKGEPFYDALNARVAIASIQWQASKLQPKKYGDKVEIEHTGKVTKPETDKALTIDQAEQLHRKFLESIKVRT